MTVRIDGVPVNADGFMWDGCHKIFLIDSPESLPSMLAQGWSETDIRPLSELAEAWINSCPLRFIQSGGDWTRKYIAQDEHGTVSVDSLQEGPVCPQLNLNTVHWDIDVLALSSIVHREDYNGLGADSFAMFRREKIVTAAGEMVQVPMISGSSFRGVLRRIGEELTAAALNYEGALPVAAAHLLTNGGRLGKSASPFTDKDERRLKNLIPHLAVFGGSGSSRIMSGLLKVGKVVPEMAEVAHLLRQPTSTATLLPAVRLRGEESFSHLNDLRTRTDQAPSIDRNTTTSPFGRFGVETLPAGTWLQTWVLITNATDYEIAFLRDVLDIFAQHGHLGGRIAAGHGTITATLNPKVRRGHIPGDTADWRTRLTTHRDDVVAALSKIT